MCGIELCVTNDLRHFPIGGLPVYIYKTPNLFVSGPYPAKDPVASIGEKQRSDINQPSSNIPWKKKVKDLREIRDFIIFLLLWEIFLKFIWCFKKNKE